MKKQYENNKPIALYGLSNVATIVILGIDEIDERVYYRLDTIDKKGKVRFAKIKNDSFKTISGTVKFSECVKYWKRKVIAMEIYIPENEYNIEKGYYNQSEITKLLRENKNNSKIISFIADMLEP